MKYSAGVAAPPLLCAVGDVKKIVLLLRQGGVPFLMQVPRLKKSSVYEKKR